MPNDTRVDPAADLRMTQTIVVALVLGVAIFAGVAAFVGPITTAFPPVALGLDVLALAAIGVTITSVPLSFFFAARMAASARAAPAAQRAQVFRASRVVGAALCEGPALFWCVAMLLVGNRWYLVPIALIATLMVFHFPTREAFQDATGERVPNG